MPIIRPKSFIGPERLGVFSLLYDWALDGHDFPMLGQRQEPVPAARRRGPLRRDLALPDPAGRTVNDTFNIGAARVRDDELRLPGRARRGRVRQADRSAPGRARRSWRCDSWRSSASRRSTSGSMRRPRKTRSSRSTRRAAARLATEVLEQRCPAAQLRVVQGASSRVRECLRRLPPGALEAGRDRAFEAILLGRSEQWAKQRRPAYRERRGEPRAACPAAIGARHAAAPVDQEQPRLRGVAVRSPCLRGRPALGIPSPPRWSSVRSAARSTCSTTSAMSSRIDSTPENDFGRSRRARSAIGRNHAGAIALLLPAWSARSRCGSSSRW